MTKFSIEFSERILSEFQIEIAMTGVMFKFPPTGNLI